MKLYSLPVEVKEKVTDMEAHLFQYVGVWDNAPGNSLLWGHLGKTNCCGAVSISTLMPTLDQLIELFKSYPKTIYHLIGFHEGLWGELGNYMPRLVDEFNAKVNGFAHLSLHIVNRKECILILQSLDHNKLATFLGIALSDKK